jgi:hypothetical protein
MQPVKPLEPQITIRAVAPVVAGLEEADLRAAFGSDWTSSTARVRRSI